MSARNIAQHKKVVGEYTYPAKDNLMHDTVQEVVSGVEQPYSYNPLTTAGLTLGLFGGDEIIDGVLTVHLATTVALTASATNYVERTRLGTVSANTSGWTPGKEPLFTAVTDTGAIIAGGLTDKRGCNRKTYGRVAKATTGGTTVLTVDEARCDLLAFTGTLTSNAVIEVPAIPWVWPEVYNGCTGAYTLTVKVNGQAGREVPPGKRITLSCDGTDVHDLSGYLRADGGTITGNVTLTGSAVMTLANDPVSAMQAATMQFVEAMFAGLDPKPACDAAAVTNIASLSGEQTIDGALRTTGRDVLLTAQSTGSQNGPWRVAGGAWSRPPWFNTSAEATSGATIPVVGGTDYAMTEWMLTTADPITLDTTPLTFVMLNGANQIVVSNGLTKTGPKTIAGVSATDALIGVSRFATLAEAIAGALTNVGITPDTLKGVARLMGYETLSFPAGSLRPRANNGCAGLATLAGATNQPDVDYLAFDGATEEYAKGSTLMPKSWDGGAIYGMFVHRRASGTVAANVVLGLKARCFGDDESPAQNFGTGATVTAPCSTTTANWKISGITGACTVGGSPAGGKKMGFEFYRAGATGGDTLDSVDCWVSDFAILYKVGLPNDNSAVA